MNLRQASDFINNDKTLVQEKNINKTSISNIYTVEVPFRIPTPVEIELVEKHLSLNELTSLLFLMSDDPSLYSELLDKKKAPPISTWISSENQCILKLFECLFIIKNYKVLNLLGINKYDASYIFSHAKSNISIIKKTLYTICDSFHESINIGTAVYYCFELLLMDWIRKKELRIEQPYDLNRLKKYLHSTNKEHLSQKLHEFETIPVSLDATVEIGESSNLEDHYPIFDCNNLGLCLIINQENFVENAGVPARTGSHLDVALIQETMKHFKFKMELLKSFLADEIEGYITTSIKEKLEPTHSMLFIFLMSHGTIGRIISHDGKLISINSIKKAIRNSKCLNSRPVALIVQACQGNYYYTSKIEHDGPEKILANDLTNIVVCMSAVPGFASFRHVDKGTFYIQIFCETLRKYENEDFHSILTKVQKQLTNPYLYGEGAHENIKVAMLPEFYSRLEKKLYLKKLC